MNRILTNFIPGRTKVLLKQLSEDGLLATIPAPTFNQQGGTVESDFRVRIENFLTVSQKLYYTLDGSDPRLSGGALASGAQLYDPDSDGIKLTSSTTVCARVRGTTAFDQKAKWSALAKARFQVGSVPADASNIAISEIHYHPANPSDEEREAGFTEDQAFEFLELHNWSDFTVSLQGIRIAGGIEFAFADAVEIAAGEYLVIVGNAAAFARRYGHNIRVAGEFVGKLSNSGERLALVDAQHQLLSEVVYDDTSPWPDEADGSGHTLTRNDLQLGDANDPSLWQASTAPGGSPSVGDNVNVGLDLSILDTDGDGVTGLEEALAGTDPTDPTSVLRILSIELGTEGAELTWSSVDGKIYRLEFTNTLSNAPWESVTTQAAEGEVTTVIDTTAERHNRQAGFYRVVVAK